VDPLFPPPENISANKKAFFTSENPLAENRFELIFDEIMDGPALEELFRDCEKVEEELGRIDEDDVVFENDGQ
jgi:chaperonin cofactor prefoldin